MIAYGQKMIFFSSASTEIQWKTFYSLNLFSPSCLIVLVMFCWMAQIISLEIPLSFIASYEQVSMSLSSRHKLESKFSIYSNQTLFLFQGRILNSKYILKDSFSNSLPDTTSLVLDRSTGKQYLFDSEPMQSLSSQNSALHPYSTRNLTIIKIIYFTDVFTYSSITLK